MKKGQAIALSCAVSMPNRKSCNPARLTVCENPCYYPGNCKILPETLRRVTKPPEKRHKEREKGKGKRTA